MRWKQLKQWLVLQKEYDRVWTQVRTEADLIMHGISCAKHIIDAATQSASQYRSTRDALRKARLEEKAAQERERKRKEKEDEREEKKRLKKEERDMQKASKKAEKQAEKEKEQAEAEAAEEAEDGDDNANGKRKARRVRGAEELEPSDYPVLLNRIGGCEMKVETEMKAFLEACLLGLPVVWRSRRSLIKKVLDECGSFEGKKSQNINQGLQADLRSFISEFAGLCEKEPEKVKSTRAVSEASQEARMALSMDASLVALLEEKVQAGEKLPDACVLEYDDIAAELQTITDRMQEPEEKEGTKTKEKEGTKIKVNHQANQELQLWKALQMVGFRKGASFDGVMSGLYPHMIYQTEGSRAISIVSVEDATSQTHLAMFIYYHSFCFDFN